MCRSMMLIALLALGATCTESAGTLTLTGSDCGDASTHGKVSGLDPSSSLAVGQKTKITGSVILDEALTAGTFKVHITVGTSVWGIVAGGDICAAKTWDLVLGFGKITWDGLNCPLKAGAQQIPFDMTLSENSPMGFETTKMVITMASKVGAKLVCMQVNSAPALSAEASTETQVGNYLRGDAPAPAPVPPGCAPDIPGSPYDPKCVAPCCFSGCNNKQKCFASSTCTYSLTNCNACGGRWCPHAALATNATLVV